MVKDIYISKELVFNEELSELDLELKDEFKYDWDSDKNFIEIDVIKDKKLRKGSYVDTTPLKIKDLEKLVTKLKKKGATHIQMAHYGDHYGYEFSGFKIELADDKLIENYKSENEKKNTLYSKYNKLQLEMNKVSSEISNLKI